MIGSMNTFLFIWICILDSRFSSHNFDEKRSRLSRFTKNIDCANRKPVVMYQRNLITNDNSKPPDENSFKDQRRIRLLMNVPIFVLLTLTIFAKPGVACPNEIRTFCECVDESDGILLNCTTGVDVVELLNTMRVVQSHIGLLKLLSIRNSKISTLPNNLFSGLYIKRLEMVNCKIRSTEDGAFSGLESTLTEMNLSNNMLEEIPVKALNGFHSLIKLHLSNNSIGELKIEDALPNLPKLVDIDLSRNKISNIHKTFFDNAKNNLQTINLGHNEMVEVPASALRGFRQLMALHIHNNQLRNLSALSFMNLPVLSLLNLASNKINFVHKQAFLNAPNLRFLYMTDNQLTKIQPYQFASFEELEMIDLSNNKLVSIDNDSFSNSKALKQLYLGENLISQVEEYAFDNSSVVVLILESNQLTEVSKDMFKGATKLQQLSLKDNKIKNVDPNAFYNNRALVMVDLSHNEIMDLAPATFLSQLNMLLVDMSYNKLSRTPYSAFNRRITTVLLQENPLVCTEKMHMIQQGSGVFMPNSEDIICNRTKTTQQGNSTLTSTLSSSITSSEKTIDEQESAFKQLPVNEMPQSDREENQHLNHLPNIQKLLVKTISTAQINQFIEQSQFQSSNDKTVAKNHEERPQTTNIAETTVKHRPLYSAFSHFLQHTTTRFPMQTSSLSINKEHDVTTTGMTSVAETIKPTEKYDIANDPNVIYPLPVPFLKGPPKMHTARVHSHNSNDDGKINNIVITQTLPPSILIAPERPLQRGHTSEHGYTLNNENIAHTTESPYFTNYTKIERFELNNNLEHESSPSFESASSGKFASFDSSLNENDHPEGRHYTSHNFSTIITIACMSIVILVFCAVLVGLCVARRRQTRLLDADSSVGMSASPNGYPSHNYHHSHMAAARAAQMNVMYGSGTLSRTGTLSRLPPLQDDIYGWMYPPTAYNTYINK